MLQYKLTSSMALRKWLILALIVLALLTVIAISYFTLSTGWSIVHLHALVDGNPPSNPRIMYPHP
jgi:hypothetical protein